jgi:hypothetical protein
VPDDVNNYQLLSDLSQQRDFMVNFNHYFKRVVNHIIELSSFLQRKEQGFVEQIESLSKQNQVLFDENIELQRRVSRPELTPMHAASSELLLIQEQTDPVGKSDAAGIVTETCNFMLARFDMMKQSLWDEDSSTCFYSEKMLHVPKKMKFIPVADTKVHSALSNGLD